MKLDPKLKEDIEAVGFRVVDWRGVSYISMPGPNGEYWHMEYDFELFYLYEHVDVHNHLVDTFDNFDDAYKAAKDLT